MILLELLNQYNQFIKNTFGNVEMAKDFLNNYFPQSLKQVIDLETLELQMDSFINEERKEWFSDLLFKVDIDKREGYIYFLFKQKSDLTSNIPFQLLKCMMGIWEAKMKNEKTFELPVIIPLVIYYGKEQGNINTSLGEVITAYDTLPEDVRLFIPNYKYLLYDLSEFKDEDIKGSAQLKKLLTIFKYIFNKN